MGRVKKMSKEKRQARAEQRAMRREFMRKKRLMYREEKAEKARQKAKWLGQQDVGPYKLIINLPYLTLCPRSTSLRTTAS